MKYTLTLNGVVVGGKNHWAGVTPLPGVKRRAGWAGGDDVQLVRTGATPTLVAPLLQPAREKPASLLGAGAAGR